MADKKRVRSIIALALIVGMGLTGAAYVGYRLVTRAPAHVRALAQAQILLDAGKYREAHDEASKALNNPDTDVDARRLMARARYLVKEFEPAATILRDGMGLYPPDSEGRLHLSLDLVRVYIYQVAHLVDTNPDKLTLTVVVAGDSQVSQQIDRLISQSAELLEELDRAFPKNGRVYQAVGHLYQTRAELAQATGRAYQEEIRGFRLTNRIPDEEAALRRYAATLNQVRSLSFPTENAFRMATLYDPSLTDSHVQLAQILYGRFPQPDLPGALTQLELAAKNDPDNLRVGLSMVEVLDRLGKTDQALQEIQALEKRRPQDADVLLRHARLLIDQADDVTDPAVRQDLFSRAKELCDRAEKTAPQNPVLWFVRGRFFMETGNPSEAVANLNRLTTMSGRGLSGPFMVQARYYLGLAHLSAGDSSRGIEELTRSVDLMKEIMAFLPADVAKRMNAMQVLAQTRIVQAMLDEGTLGDAPERMLQTMAIDLDNDLVHDLLRQALAKEADPRKVMRLTVAAVNLRILSGKPQLALEEAQAALKDFPESEPLLAAAGTACLLSDDFEKGMSYFTQASRVRALNTEAGKLTPEEYAQRQYVLLVQIQSRRNMHAQVEEIIDRALRQFPDATTLLITRAEYLRSRRRLGAAVEAYRRAIEVDPKRASLHILLARTYRELDMKEQCREVLTQLPPASRLNLPSLIDVVGLFDYTGQKDKVLSMLEQIQTNLGTRSEVKLYLAQEFFKQDKPQRALELLEGILVGPTPVDAYLLKANILMTLGRYEESVAVLEQTQEAKPGHASFYPLGLLYLKIDQPYKTISLVQAIQSKFPEYTNNRLLEAGALFHTDKPDLALVQLEEAFSGLGSMFNNRTRVQLTLACHLAQNHLDQALQSISPDTNISTKTDQALAEEMAQLLRQFDALNPSRRREALRAFVRTTLARQAQLSNLLLDDDHKLLQLLPAQPVLTARYAADLTQNGQPEKAVQTLQACLAQNPRFAEGWRLLGQLAQVAGDLAVAQDALERFLTLIDDAPAVEVQLAQVLAQRKDIPGAMDRYRAVIEKSDNFPLAFNNLAYYIATGPSPDLPLARKYARKAVDLAPYAGSFQDTLGWCDYLAGDYQQALTSLEKAGEILPWDPTVLYHLGMVHLKMGNGDQARDRFQQALALVPNFPEAQLAREELRKLGSS